MNQEQNNFNNQNFNNGMMNNQPLPNNQNLNNQEQTIQPGVNTTTQSSSQSREELRRKVYCQVTEPSYVNGEENLLKWNKETKQFELTLTNTKTIDGMSANATVKADETTLPEGVKVVAEGETLKITSTSEYLDTKTIKIYIMRIVM